MIENAVIRRVDNNFWMRWVGKENQTVARAPEFNHHSVGGQIEVALLRLKMDGVRADEKSTGGAPVRKIGMKRAACNSPVVLCHYLRIRHPSKLTATIPLRENEINEHSSRRPI